MSKLRFFITMSVSSALFAGCYGDALLKPSGFTTDQQSNDKRSASPTPIVTGTPAPTSTPISTPTPSPTPIVTVTPLPTVTPTPTPSPTMTSTPVPTPTPTSTPPPGPTGSQQFSLSNRELTGSILIDIFGVAAVTPVAQLISYNYQYGQPCNPLLQEGTIRGYPLQFKAGDCLNTAANGNYNTDSKIGLHAPSSVARQAYNSRVCNRIVQDDSAVRFAAFQISTYPDPISIPPTSNDQELAYQLFFPGVTPNQAVKDQMAAIVAKAMNPTTPFPTGTIRENEAWRFLFLVLCQDGWQVQ